MTRTEKEYNKIIDVCSNIFRKKLKDYGVAWRVLRTTSLTDQIFIKAKRIRSIETKGIQKVDESIVNEFIAIINYSIISLIQIELGESTELDISEEKAIELYDNLFDKAKKLMLDKNHDYDEAWRTMRVSSFTDLIIMKLFRTKQIEDNEGKTIVSEGVDANYYDMLNYSVFAMIKLTLGNL